MKRIALRCSFALMVLLSSIHSRPAFAQAGNATAEITCTVTDSSGAVVVGAAITASDPVKGIRRTAVGNERGEYRVLSLPPGTYSVKVEAPGFTAQQKDNVEVTVGETANLNFALQVGQISETVSVLEEVPLIEIERTQQSNTINERYIRNLPIDRRDYLTYTLLAPGVVDSNALADNTDFRVRQTPQSGLSFYGSNGRGNSVTVDGAEANDTSGGVRSTLSQEAVQEFQINRSNYTAELGGATGGVINIVSKSGSNTTHGSVFGFFRNQNLDATDPFALVLDENANVARRLKPPAGRQQYGATLGGPIVAAKTFFFGGFEGLRRRESSTVPVLTDLNIFQPTPDQAAIIGTLAANPSPSPVPCLNGGPNLAPAPCATALRDALTAKPATQGLFRANSGVFPFNSDSHAFSVRLDHTSGSNNTFFLRYNFTKSNEVNQTTRALIAFSRSNNVDVLDSDITGDWTHIFSPSMINEVRLQSNYRKSFVLPNETNGPELNVTGFGFFNRDIFLPARSLERRQEWADNLTFAHGTHRLKFGVSTLLHNASWDFATFLGGRFGFSVLPGSLVSSQLAATTINQLQGLDQGLPTSYQQGFGNGIVKATLPYYSFYAQDTWNVRPNLTFNYGLRYELDNRLNPVPTYKKNFGPRVGFSWDPLSDKKTIVRGGYGIFYAPDLFVVDYVSTALNEINGFRPLPQVLTTLNSADPFAINGPPNIFRTLQSQGVIGIPQTVRTIAASDLAQFGITVSQTGPRNPLSVLFRPDPTYRNPDAQQASLAVEREFSKGLSVSASYTWVLTQHITRARDINLLPRPIYPGSGIREWTARSGCTGAGLSQCFRDPLLYQEILYESAASAVYNGGIVELTKRFSGSFALSGNYTYSKAFDEVTDYNSDFRAMDQTNEKAERALSAFDERHKFVAYAVLQNRGFTLTPIFRANSGRPFNLLTGSDLNGDRSTNGDRPAFAGRNTGMGPAFWTFDLRLARQLKVGSETRVLELTAEGFNLFNRLNFSSINNTVGPAFQGPFNVTGRNDRSPSQPLGFTSAFDPRRIQLGARFRF